MPSSSHAPARIAIVRLSHLGDIVLALPVFHALRAAYPRARIVWVAQSEFASLLDGLPGLERVVRFERRGGLRAWIALRAQLREFAAELAVDAQGNWKSAAATWCTGAARRVGLARVDWREKLAAGLISEHAAPCAPQREHAFERSLALGRHLVGDFTPRRDPDSTAVELASAGEHFARLVDASRCVILQLSPRDDVRSWPVERAAQLARALAADGTAVVVLSGPAEVTEAREVEARCADEPRIRHWIGQRGLRELAAFFSVSAQRGARYIGCDTGPTHLAAACGLPVVVLAGPQSHLRTGPWPVAVPSPWGSSEHRAVRSSDPPTCAPCFARKCSHALGPVCMSAIRADEVLAVLARREE